MNIMGKVSKPFFLHISLHHQKVLRFKVFLCSLKAMHIILHNNLYVYLHLTTFHMEEEELLRQWDMRKFNWKLESLIRVFFYRNACKIFRDGPLPCPLAIDAGARSFSKTTRTMLQRKRRLSSILMQTGATRTFMYKLVFIQHLQVDGIHLI